MPFQPAQFNQRQSRNAPPMRYCVRKTRTGTGILQITVSNELAKQAGWSPDQKIRLDFDAKAGLGRLTPINHGQRCMRGKKGSVCGSWPHNGDIAKLLPKSNGESATVPLTVVDVSKTEGITFDLPKSDAA